LVLINFLNNSSKKNLILLFLVNFLSISQAHVPSIFLVYLFGVLIVFAFYLKKWKKVLISGLIIFLVNSFWLMPYIYSTSQNAKVIVNSKINRLSNPEVILMNRSFGDLKSVFLLHSFNLDYGDWDKDGNYGFQMPIWRNLWQDPKIELLGYTLFSFVMLGVLVSPFRKQRPYLPFILILLFVFSNLATDAPVFSKVVEFLRQKIPFYKEVFRFSFTKFAVFYVFCLSIFIGSFLELISGKIIRWLRLIVILGLIGAILAISWPAFKGELLYDRLKLAVPDEYFELFRYFNSQGKDGRVAILPQPSFWNWEYLKWGYRGSGFIWQGISKPTLHRSFDPWSSFNETYFNELDYAIDNKDKLLFNQVLKRYEVQWIVLDEYIYQPGGWGKDFFTNEAFRYVENNSNISLVNDLGRIKVYEFNLTKDDQYISTPKKYTPVNINLTYSQIDPIYQKYGDYIEDENGVGYPFVNFDPRGPVSIDSSSSELIFENKKANSKVTFPVKGKVVESFGEDRGFKEANNCDLRKLGKVSKSRLKNDVLYRAEGGGVSCDFYAYDNLSYDKAYVLRIKGENKEGRSLKIYFQNWETGRMDLEELLPTGKFDNYFVVLPKLSNKKGYTLNLETRSFGRIASENRVENIEIYPFDLSFLTSLVQNPENEAIINSNLRVEDVRKLGTAFYKVQTSGSGLLVLGQGYEKGWLAFEGKTLLRHVKVDSWANGWLIPSGQVGPSRVVIVFWPQLLEWFGFLVLLGSFCGLGLFAG
jgi:hypothetical protein